MQHPKRSWAIDLESYIRHPEPKKVVPKPNCGDVHPRMCQAARLRDAVELELLLEVLHPGRRELYD